MQIIGTPRESDNIGVFLEKRDESERETFVLKIVLGALVYAPEKASNLSLFRFACLSLSEL